MEVMIRPLDIDENRAQPSGAQHQARVVLAPLAPVSAEHHVAGKKIFMGRDQSLQLGTSDFFLAFEEEFQV
jgi:hypothetical protein